MAGKNQPVDWMFAFKFNAASYPGCAADGVPPPIGRAGIFGGTVKQYMNGHSQQYVFATSANPALVKGTGCLGATLTDPLGATFGQVYNTPGYCYVLWNDQFYNDPTPTVFSPWGHSKGMLAWNDDGEGFVLQVSTPSWPASGSSLHPRQNDGNTLGCINDDDIEVCQHFFALKLTKTDLTLVLAALANSSVWTEASQPSIVNNGGPLDIKALVNGLGKLGTGKACTIATLSSKVQVISKPSNLQVPPWQLISAKLGGIPLRVASWWTDPDEIYSTPAGQVPGCWETDLGKPGAVTIATSGIWNGISFGLLGGDDPNANHAKIGVSTDAKLPICIFGDMNQQGTLNPASAEAATATCELSQNGRGGLFYVLSNPTLFASLTSLLSGRSAPQNAPAPAPSVGQ
jgi:hypothetical protein